MALILLSVLSGTTFALIQKTEFRGEFTRQLKQFMPDGFKEVTSDSGKKSAPKPSSDGSSEMTPIEMKELPDEQTVDQEHSNVTSSTTDTGARHQTNSTGKDQTKEGPSKDSINSETHFDFSDVDPSLRETLIQARRFFRRARKHNSRVNDPALSSERRREENSKTRTNAERSLKLLKRVKGQMDTPDKNVEELLDRVRKIYRKSFRRAKMWGGY